MSYKINSEILGSIAGLIVVFGACQPPDREGARPASQSLTLQQHVDACTQDPRVQLGLVPLDVCVGADLFFREPFGGNGRTCATCHPAANNFTIDPAFIAGLPSSDKLFVAEQVPALAGLERPTLMRQSGLILENVDGAETPTSKFVMRSVPHCFSLGVSVTAQAVPTDGTTRPPNERTGWSGDGAPNAGELRDFQTGAIVQHYTKSLDRVPGTDFTLATSDELDRIVAFLRTIGRTNELTLSGVSLTDANAEAGRLAFLDPAKRCNGCHNNAGANVAAGFNRNFDTGVERARLATLDGQGIPRDGGFGGGAPGAPFNFDANQDGINDAFGNGTFNTPPLIEAADTGPFFHTNAFDSIEDAIGFYTSTAFAQSPAGGGNAIPLSAADVANLGKFLRTLNVSFNAQLAIRRANAVVAIIDAVGDQSLQVQRDLLTLAAAEVDDAVDLLKPFPQFYQTQRVLLLVASNFLTNAATQNHAAQRRSFATSALDNINMANAGLGSGLTLSVGAGTLMN
jgi:cytochrome c peroxidase